MRRTVRVPIACHFPSTCTASAHVIPHHEGDETRRAAGLTAAGTLVHPALCRQRITRDHVGPFSGNERAPYGRTALGSAVSRAAHSDAVPNQSSSACPSARRRRLGGRDLRKAQHHSVRSWPPPKWCQAAPTASIHNHDTNHMNTAVFRAVPD